MCASCFGTGLESVECNPCKGLGVTNENISFWLKLPASIDDQMICRVKGKGNEAINGLAGDLLVHVNVLPDKKYTR